MQESLTMAAILLIIGVLVAVGWFEVAIVVLVVLVIATLIGA